MGKIQFGVLHCTATPEGRNISIDTLMSWFMSKPPRGNGWSKPGYRTVIDLDGRSHDLVEFNNDEIIDWSEITYGAKGWNSKSIHLAYIGGVDHNFKSKDTRNPDQQDAMEAHVKVITSYHPDIVWVGHNQINHGKACPSFDAVEWLRWTGIPEKNIGTDFPMGLESDIDSGDAFDVNMNEVVKYFSNQ